MSPTDPRRGLSRLSVLFRRRRGDRGDHSSLQIDARGAVAILAVLVIAIAFGAVVRAQLWDWIP